MPSISIKYGHHTNGTNEAHRGPFPSATSTKSSWREEPGELDTHRTTTQLPFDCDVVIVGAGLAGVATAYHLLDIQGISPSVIILEARQTCSGATGRNGGHLKLAYSDIAKNVEKHGTAAAAEVVAFQNSHCTALKKVVEKERIECDFRLTRSLDVVVDQAMADRVEAGFSKQVKTMPKAMREIGYLGRKYVERLSGVRGAECATTVTAASLWPYKFVIGLVRVILAKGGNLQTETPVTSISSSDDGVSLVQTPRGSIRCKKVVIATNAYTSAIMPQYSHKIIPTKAICSRIAVPATSKVPALSHTYGVHGAEQYEYLVPRPDGSIILGGGKHTYVHDRRKWYDVADDSSTIEGVERYFDGYMQRHFLGWEGSGAYVDRVWSGIVGYTSDGLPHIGQVPGQPNQYIMAGFNGGGMPLIFLSAKGVARMVRDGIAFEATGIPKIFKTTQERLDSKVNIHEP